MARTVFATNDAAVKKAWNERLFRDVIAESYFPRFFGSDSSSLVHVDTQLEKGQGDRITFMLRTRDTSPGVTGNTPLEGNEAVVGNFTFNLSLEEYAHGVRVRRGIDQQRAAFSVTDEAEAQIKDWMEERIDQLCFDAIGLGTGATASPTKVLFRTAATTFSSAASYTAAAAALNGTASNGTLSMELLSALRAYSKTGGARQTVPLRPVKVDGKEYLVLLTHPDSMFDLKASSGWQQAQREARERSDENPIFTGAAGVVDGIVIHEHERCATFTNGAGSTLPWNRALLMGAQALTFAFGKRPEIVQEDFDYKREVGYGMSVVMGAAAPTFNSQTFGAIGVAVARTNISIL